MLAGHGVYHHSPQSYGIIEGQKLSRGHTVAISRRHESSLVIIAYHGNLLYLSLP